MIPPLRIETERLVLRPPTLADADAIYAEYAQDPDVTRYLSWKPHRQVGTVEAFLREGLAEQERGGRWLWAITAQGIDRPVGMVDVHHQGHRLTTGYVLARRLWGKGYMREAVRPLIEWALRQDHIHRVWAFCDVDNRASARVLEKVGMQREGTLRRWFVHPNISDVPRDCYAYSCVKG